MVMSQIGAAGGMRGIPAGEYSPPDRISSLSARSWPPDRLELPPLIGLIIPPKKAWLLFSSPSHSLKSQEIETLKQPMTVF